MAKPLNQLSGMPKVDTALRGWQNNITLETVVDNINNDGLNVPIRTQVTFKGTIQPLSPEQIQLKPEGQRAWRWLQIHAVAGTLNLDVNDIVVYDSIDYKVMGINDYSLSNFIEYHVVKDYQT